MLASPTPSLTMLIDFLADAVVDDADRLRDRHRAVTARIEHGQLALVEGLVVRPLERPAWLAAVARVGIVAVGRHARTDVLGLRRRNVQEEAEQGGDEQ